MEADEVAKRRLQRMIRIAITEAAFEAISRTLPLGSVSFEQTRSLGGEVYIWLGPREVDKLMAERRQGEGYSETIIRLAAMEEGGPRRKPEPDAFTLALRANPRFMMEPPSGKGLIIGGVKRPPKQ
jgi:hypothetical protein